MTGALGLIMDDENAGEAQDEKLVASLVEILLGLRQSARGRKEWATADLIRNSLLELGIVVEDSPQGARWKRS